MRGATQRGVVMVIALIMLAIVTLIGTVSANIVMGNLQVVQNVEAAAAVRNNAVSAIQEAIGTNGFFEGEKAFVSGCQGSNNSRCFDMTGDGAVDDMRVEVSQPECISVQPNLTRANADKSWLDSKEGACWGSGKTSTNDCSDVVWEVTVAAEDQVTGARVRMRQGISTRAHKNEIANACNLSGTSGS